MSPQPQKFAATVSPEGKIEIDVALPPGTPVEVVVCSLQEDADTEIIAAAAESLHFYDPPPEEARKQA
jgi:hypothetical protein